MPWKECHVMDERLRFVARLLEGEKMASLCAEFGISRKTGYKIFERYKDCGVAAFTDRSRRTVDQTENGVRGSQIACRNVADSQQIDFATTARTGGMAFTRDRRSADFVRDAGARIQPRPSPRPPLRRRA